MNISSVRFVAGIAVAVLALAGSRAAMAELPQLTPTQQVAPTAAEVAADADDWIYFGFRVWVDGDTAMVLMPEYGDVPGYVRGRIAIYQRGISRRWVRSGTLDPGSNDGYSALMFKDGTAFVQGAGGIYVFRERHGAWIKTATLSLPTSSRPMSFGGADSLRYDHGIVAVPAEYTDDYTRVVYVSRLNGMGQAIRWTQIVPRDPQPLTGIGTLDLNDDTLVVSAATATQNGVFVFRHVGDRWVQTQVISEPGSSGPSSFGASLALNHGVLVVGDPYARSFAGDAYLYTAEHSQFRYRKALHPTADQLSNYSVFGSRIVMDRGRVVISSLEPPSYLYANGVAVVYELHDDDAVATHLARFDDSLAMSLSGNELLLGSPYFVDYDDNSFHQIGWADFYTLPPIGH